MTSRTPDMMPVLSRGKHRSPRKGACFMELASYLAGERWSDHPRCTHPLLAALAREVNDHVGDHARTRLAPLIPDVIGLNGPDPRVYPWIARDAAAAALPIADARRQGVAAVSILRCERVLNGLEGRPLDDISPTSERALAGVPHANAWAQQFVSLGFGSSRHFGKRSAPAIVHSAVSGISDACVDDTDSLLIDLLEDTIAKCQQWFHTTSPSEYGDRWAEACELTVR